jgi:alkylated DNA repair dioxygenase AlkB
LAQVMAALDARYRPELGEPLCTAGLCLYRDGRDSVAWHGDISGRKVSQTVVAIVSFGNPRALMLRPLARSGPTLRYLLGHGDLLVMGGTCQRTWQHAIPKTAAAIGPRISVQFRPAGIR